jgi:hypothetical protein
MLTALSAAARVHAHQSVNLESLSEGWARDGKSRTPISYEQLEERLRSLDYALDTAAKTCPLAKNRREERSGTPMKMRREDGVAMSSYRGWKMLNIWRAVSAEYGHRFDGICEVGINLGHSPVLWLEGQPSAHVYLWDIGTVDKEVCGAVFGYLRYTYTERVSITQGDSYLTLRAAAAKANSAGGSGPMCDIIAVDGAKTYTGRLHDMEALRNLSRPGALLLLDDSRPGDVVNLTMPRKQLATPVDQLYRDLLVRRKIQVVDVLRSEYDAPSVHRRHMGGPVLNQNMGHGTLVARWGSHGRKCAECAESRARQRSKGHAWHKAHA